MSNRSIIELNHDYPPTQRGGKEWLDAMARFYASGDPRDLPDGVTWFGTRHHSEPCPLGHKRAIPTPSRHAFTVTLHRAPDWPPDVHAAAQVYEKAMTAVARATHADELIVALSELQRGKDAFGQALLELDKARRPLAYR